MKCRNVFLCNIICTVLKFLGCCEASKQARHWMILDVTLQCKTMLNSAIGGMHRGPGKG